jgi:hypothetical protein
MFSSTLEDEDFVLSLTESNILQLFVINLNKSRFQDLKNLKFAIESFNER